MEKYSEVLDDEQLSDLVKRPFPPKLHHILAQADFVQKGHGNLEGKPARDHGGRGRRGSSRTENEGSAPGRATFDVTRARAGPGPGSEAQIFKLRPQFGADSRGPAPGEMHGPVANTECDGAGANQEGGRTGPDPGTRPNAFPPVYGFCQHRLVIRRGGRDGGAGEAKSIRTAGGSIDVTAARGSRVFFFVQSAEQPHSDGAIVRRAAGEKMDIFHRNRIAREGRCQRRRSSSSPMASSVEQ